MSSFKIPFKTWKVPGYKIKDLTTIIHSMYLSEAVVSKVTPGSLSKVVAWTYADIKNRNAVIIQIKDDILFLVFLAIGEETSVDISSVTSYIHRDVIELERKSLSQAEQKEIISLTDITKGSIRMVTAPNWTVDEFKRIHASLKGYL